MKIRRFLSGLLFGIGCALTFVGLLAAILPAAANPQMKLVLSSFFNPSDIFAIDLINRFMSFALAQGWRLVWLGLMAAAFGCGLLLYFQPRRKEYAAKPVAAVRSESVSVTAPVQTVEDPEAPNPFAVSSYQPAPASEAKAVSSFQPYAAPMLERNRIDDAVFSAAAGGEPYFSPRFDAESHAVQTEVSARSQSGSRLLYRPEPVIPAEPAPEPLHAAPEPAAPKVTPASPIHEVPETAAVPARYAPPVRTSPRIRSTMGRHSMSGPQKGSVRS